MRHKHNKHTGTWAQELQSATWCPYVHLAAAGARVRQGPASELILTGMPCNMAALTCLQLNP